MNHARSRGGDKTSASGSAGPLKPFYLGALAVASLVAAQMPTFLTAGVAVQIQRDLNFGTSALGMAIAASLAASTVGSVPLSRVVQHLGWARGMQVAAVVSAMALVGVAALATSWAALTGILILGGLAKSLGHPAANLAIAAEAPPRHRGLLFGIKQAGVPATATLAGLSVPLLALTLGWRSAFWAAAAGALIFGLAVPRHRPARETKLRSAAPSSSRKEVHAVSLIPLAAAAGMGVAVANSLASFLTTYSVEVGFSEGAAGFVLAVGSATGIAMRVLIGWLADRHTLGLGAVSLLLVIGSVGIAMLTTGSQILIVFGSMLAFGAGWGWAGLFNLAVVQRNPQAPAVATGFTQIGVYVGAGLGPFLFGVLAEHASFQTAWWVFATMAIFAAALMRVGDRATLRAAGVQIPD